VLENRNNKNKTITNSWAVVLQEVTERKLKGQIEAMNEPKNDSLKKRTLSGTV
jgi:hypothetical protein